MQEHYLDVDDSDDWEIIGGARVLKDRKSLRVPLHLMDATQRDVSTNNDKLSPSQHRANDRLAFDAAAKHRPGFRLYDIGETQRQEVQAARDAYQDYITNAWRGGDATGETQGHQEGDPCVVRSGGRDEGSRGSMKKVDGKWQCVPSGDARDHSSVMAELYRQRDLEDSQLWQDKKVRRTNAKNQEEGEFESEDDDDTPRGRAAAEADDSMTLQELRQDHKSIMDNCYQQADRELRAAYKNNK
jgi:hypothetical protein